MSLENVDGLLGKAHLVAADAQQDVHIVVEHDQEDSQPLDVIALILAQVHD